MRNDSNDALLCLEIGNDKGGLSYSILPGVLIEGDSMGCCRRACGAGLGGSLTGLKWVILFLFLVQSVCIPFSAIDPKAPRLYIQRCMYADSCTTLVHIKMPQRL